MYFLIYCLRNLLKYWIYFLLIYFYLRTYFSVTQNFDISIPNMYFLLFEGVIWSSVCVSAARLAAEGSGQAED